MASWMQIADVQFLALLADAEEALPVAVVADQTFFPVDYVRRRCGLLAAEGLVQPVGGDVYELRDLGAAFLDGDVDSDRLEGPA
jgi:hypothetical protein